MSERELYSDNNSRGVSRNAPAGKMEGVENTRVITMERRMRVRTDVLEDEGKDGRFGRKPVVISNSLLLSLESMLCPT